MYGQDHSHQCLILVDNKAASTPFEPPKLKDNSSSDAAVNVHYYRSMIGSLMYLTASRPDIMFAVSACARNQVSPTTSNLLAVKRIFKYLKAFPKLGLWYPRDSPFHLEAFSDSDYAGATGDQKSTTGGCQYLGETAYFLACKKQTIVATSSCEAEYAQLLHVVVRLKRMHKMWFLLHLTISAETQSFLLLSLVSADLVLFLLLYFVCAETSLHLRHISFTQLFNFSLFNTPNHNPAVKYLPFFIFFNHSTMADLKFYVEHNKVAFLEKTKRKSDGFHDIIDFIKSTPIRYALVTNPIVRESLVRQFWATASEVSLPDGTVGIEATIDGHAHTITEASIRSSLRLNDQGATVCLPTDDIYSGLADIGYVPDQGVWRLCFFKNKFSPQWKFLVHTLIHCIDSKVGSWNQIGSHIASALLCLAHRRPYNFSSLIFQSMVSNITATKKFLMYPRFIQMILNVQPTDTTSFPSNALTAKLFANMRNFQGTVMPLLPTMLTIVDESVGQSSQEVPQMHPDPNPSTIDLPVSESAHAPSVVVTSSGPPVDPGQSSTPPVVTQGMGSSGSTPVVPSDPLSAPVLSPIMEEETGGGPVFESPLRSPHVSPPVTPPVSTTEGVAGDPVTLTSLSLVVNSLVQKVSSLENALTDMKQTHGKVVIRLINKVKHLENKLKQRKRNVIVSDEDDEMVEPDADWDVFLDLARHSPTSGHVSPSMVTTSKPLSEEEIKAALTLSTARAKQRSFTNVHQASSISADRVVDSAERMDTADETISAGEAVVSAAVDIPAESSDLATSILSPLFTTSTIVSTATDAHPSTSFAPSTVEKASSPLRDPTKGKDVAEPTSPVQSLTPKELEDQHAAILEAERQEAFEMEARQSQVAEQVYYDSLLAQRLAEEEEREQRDTAELSSMRQTELDAYARNLTDAEWVDMSTQLQTNSTLAAEILGSDVNDDNFVDRVLELMRKRRKELAAQKAKEQREKPMTQAQQRDFMRTFVKNQSAAVYTVGWSMKDVKSLDDARLLDEYNKIRRALDRIHAQTLQQSLKRSGDFFISSESKRMKVWKREDVCQKEDHLQRHHTIPHAVGSDLAHWEVLSTDFGLGEIHLVRWADGSERRFTSLRDLLPYVGRSDLVILYGLVMTKYAASPASGLGLDLWGSLRNLIAASETYDASIVWHNQDQWQIHSWRFYGETGVHVLETVAGTIVYMLADKSYPIARSTIQMLLDHGLEIDSYSLRTNATSAVRLIRSLLEQLNPSS
ncbi:hypothetical protein Tco_0799607 [Tanacetum coccineum]|uniref:Reverse transcriptase Ty1/copia-type domain-containing protein n=1 Tax=Tanacetum coccineum TaxID=301880 RepID=A0ABQ4ZQS3_9ASTR